jgi:glyoxylase-like metal-dependent hydrolase (beta-lactamase superfamily II)
VAPADPGQLRVPMQVGDVAILALSDGEFRMQREFLSSPQAHDALVGHDGQVHMPIGTFLFPGDHPVLIDAGFGPAASPTLTGGSLPSQLRAAGCPPEQVELIVLTHPHPDHVGWLATADGQRPFPAARLALAAADWDYFIGQGQGEMAAHTRDELTRLDRAGRIMLLDGEQTITPYLTALPAPGHTPGHTVLAVHDHGARALLLGDALYCPQQLGHSDWAALSDVDPALAVRTRRALERDLEQHDTLAVGAHFPDLLATRMLRG